jgi:hypothetical protein
MRAFTLFDIYAMLRDDDDIDTAKLDDDAKKDYIHDYVYNLLDISLTDDEEQLIIDCENEKVDEEELTIPLSYLTKYDVTYRDDLSSTQMLNSNTLNCYELKTADKKGFKFYTILEDVDDDEIEFVYKFKTEEEAYNFSVSIHAINKTLEFLREKEDKEGIVYKSALYLYE